MKAFRTTRMRTTAVAAAAAVTAATAGCSSLSAEDPDNVFERAVIPTAEATLGDAVLAFHIGPATDEMFTPVGRVRRPGYVVLANADGSFRALKTREMDQGTLAWSDKGLYFSDESTDFILTSQRLTSFKNPKSTAQNLHFALSDGGAVGVYNHGQTGGGGYLNQVTVTTDAGARMYEVQGNYFNGADCDGQIFGLSGEPGARRSEAASLPGMTSESDPQAVPQLLARLHPPSPEGGEELVAWRPAFDAVVMPGQVPCHRGKMTFLSWDRDADGSQHPRVVTWDTRTGEYQQRALTFTDGTKLKFEPFGLSKYDERSLRKGRLDWIYADGRVFSTDIATGKTIELFKTGLERRVGGPMKPWFTFTKTKIHALRQLYDADGGLTYTVFDRDSGEKISTVSLDIANTEISVSYLNLWRIAARPES